MIRILSFQPLFFKEIFTQILPIRSVPLGVKDLIIFLLQIALKCCKASFFSWILPAGHALPWSLQVTMLLLFWSHELASQLAGNGLHLLYSLVLWSLRNTFGPVLERIAHLFLLFINVNGFHLLSAYYFSFSTFPQIFWALYMTSLSNPTFQTDPYPKVSSIGCTVPISFSAHGGKTTVRNCIMKMFLLCIKKRLIRFASGWKTHVKRIFPICSDLRRKR